MTTEANRFTLRVLSMSTAEFSRVQRFVLYGESWETYVRLLHLFDERRDLRITYDRGALEIMTLSPERENLKCVIRRLIEALTEEMGLPIMGYGSMTMKRRKKLRGLEPDECFWIQNEALVRNLKTYKLRRDPPPDLILEVDVTRSPVNRMGIYAALAVPEVWRFRKEHLNFNILDADGKYSAQPISRAFPGIPSDEINRFLSRRGQADHNTLVREFREWIRSRS